MRVFQLAKFWKFISIPFIAAVSVAVFLTAQDYRKLPKGSVRQFNRQAEPYESGPLKIGGKIPNGPGDTTFAPYLKIPASQKFYVSVAEPDTWCINEDCNLDGAFIQTLGGWLQVEDTDQAEIEATFGLDLPENQDVKSTVLIGDNEGKIIGIYPNKGLSDVMDILKLYPDLADFSFLKGVKEFGLLKVGEFAPLKPGYRISHLSSELSKFSMATIPEEKKFYIYALQKRKYDIVGMREKYENKYVCFLGGCRYPEPDPPHDFLFASIDELGGWFLANDMGEEAEMIKLFGMKPEEVLSGKISLVAVTDHKGVILALHPNKTLFDTLTILSQVPEVTNTAEWRNKTLIKSVESGSSEAARANYF